MVKEKEQPENPHNNNNNNKMFIGIVWNCVPELKLLLSALLFFCSLITLFQFFPSHLNFSVQDLRHCASLPPPPSTPSTPSPLNIPPPLNIPQHTQTKIQDTILQNGVVKRNFNTYGSAAYNFILMSAYRGGLNTFAVVGLSSKPLHVFANPTYVCEWVPADGSRNVTVPGVKILPDWGYGRVYTVVVVNCTFPSNVGVSLSGSGSNSGPVSNSGSVSFSGSGSGSISSSGSISGSGSNSGSGSISESGSGSISGSGSGSNSGSGSIFDSGSSFGSGSKSGFGSKSGSGSGSGAGTGGTLYIHASTSGGGDTNFNLTDTIEAMYEVPTSINPATYMSSEPKYDYLYCGSPLYGNLSPQRIREWIAYHVKMFGEKSHFIIHDAGGVHADVMNVLKPWIEKGYVTVQNIREEERFDGYYHNQFLVVNDCLHRYRFDTKWMFFFDVDEFIFVPKKSTLNKVMDSLSEFTQFTIEQRTISNKLCYLDDHPGKIYRKWGIEKLVYRDMLKGIRRDRKYAVQPRNVFATGVHMSENILGKTTHKTEGKIMYYHYHGTISERREPCRQFVNTTEMKVGGKPYIVDKTMREVAGAVKRFELRMIGSTLLSTRQ